MTLGDGTPHVCEVAIAGGGPAGATAGRILAGWGFDVVVIAAPEGEKAGEVIGPEAIHILDALGLTELFAQSPEIATRCDGVVSHWPSSGMDHSDHRLRGTYGWVIDRTRLGMALMKLALENGCRWLYGTVTTCRKLDPSGYQLSVNTRDEAQVVEAKFVVDATGRTGSIVRRLGARRIVDDRLIAAAIRLDRTTSQPDPYLRLTATPDGWWYCSDGPAGDTRVAMIADPRLDAGKPQALGSALRLILKKFPQAWQGNELASRMVILDASSSRLDCCAQDGWLAVGDAATAFDPLCGQGLAQAFGSALAAAHAIHECSAGNADALVAYDHAMQGTYSHSRAQLELRYAYRAQTERTPFWRARMRPSVAV